MAPDYNNPCANEFSKPHTETKTSGYVQPAVRSSQQQKTPTPASSPSCPSGSGVLLGQDAEFLQVPRTIYRRELVLVRYL
jgi:hypothetical protein